MSDHEPTSAAIAVGVVRELGDDERRVALTPDAAERLVKASLRVLVEHGAGRTAGFDDDEYVAAGAEVVDRAAVTAQATALACVAVPGPAEITALKDGDILIGLLAPLNHPTAMAALADRRVTAIAMELLPRITRAQSMDALSSQATVAGYRAVLIGALALPRFYPLLMTAAGTIRPARILVLGAGVAGLQAIATARRLGAVVSAFDVRPIVREQVESLGATFLEIDLPESGEGTGGYARELSDEAQRLQRELVAKHVAESDVVITTALIPGRPAPVLITSEMVEAMRAGSVVVDLAADAGGNCEATVPGETVRHGGVTVIGALNPASAMPQDASRMYARNVSALILSLVHEGVLRIDLDDALLADACVTHDGEVRHPGVQAALQAAEEEPT